jgi:hypothetical protein
VAERVQRAGDIARNADKYVKLVWAVYKHRYLTSEQVYRLFDWIKSERTARHYVATATANQLLARVPIRHAAVTCPAVYFATSKGLSFLKNHFAKRGIEIENYREDSRRAGKTFEGLIHDLLISEVQIDLGKTIATLGYRLQFSERRFHHPDKRLKFVVPSQSGNGTEQHIEPDACFGVSAGERYFPLFMLELDAGTMPVSRIVKKLQRYGTWADSADGASWLQATYANIGAKSPSTAFRLLIVFHHSLSPGEETEHRRMLDVLSRCSEIPPVILSRLWLVEGTKLKDHDDLTKSIWLSAADMSWQSEFGLLSRRLADRTPADRHSKQMAFMGEHVAAQVRRPLLKQV